MADRAIRQSRKDSDGDIIAIGDAGQIWSPVLKADAVYHIEAGIHRYYVPWKSGATWIHVVNGANGKYLRTDRDDTNRNNLDDLPDC